MKQERSQPEKKRSGGVKRNSKYDGRPANATKLLFAAKEKPPWCSDVRWRIELRRRKYKQYYSFYASGFFN